MSRYQALSQKIMAAVAAGEPPTIAQSYESWGAQFIESGEIADLTPFVNGDNGFSDAEWEDIYPVFRETSMIDGKVWWLPFNKSVRALYYNKDKFFLNGLDPDNPPKTTAEYIAAAQKLKAGDLEYATAFPVSAWQFENLTLSANGQLMDEDESEILFNSPAGVKALDFLLTLLNEKLAFLSTGYADQEEFLAEKIAIMEGSSVSYSFMKKQGIPFEVGVAPVPYIDEPAMIVSGTNIIMFERATPAQKKAAWTFIKWFLSGENTARWAAGTGYMPVRKSAQNTETMQTFYDEVPGYRLLLQQLDYAETEPQSAAWFRIRRELEGMVLEAALRGNKTPQEALDQIEEYAQKEIERLAQ